MTIELDDFSKKKKVKLTCDVCETLNIEKNCLDKKVDDLLKYFYKFTNVRKSFYMMLAKQRGMFDQGGISYRFLKQKYLKNYFVKASFSSVSKYICTYCNQNERTIFSYAIMKNVYFGVKQE